MKFNDINLFGVFKLKGLTGSDNQTIKYSNNEPTWRQNVPPPPNIIRGLGGNFILVESVYNDPIKSGQNLVDAYSKAEDLAVEIVASIDNRVTILVMPGLYDVQELILSTSYIDLIGFSSNARSTILFSSLSEFTIKYEQVDSKLENFDLRPGISYAVFGAGGYLRWKNLIVSGNCFGDGISSYTFDFLRGEFSDIVVKPFSTFALAQYSIDVVCNNINFEGICLYAFNSQFDYEIKGTFSNINVDNLEGSMINHSGPSDYGMVLSLSNINILNGYGGFIYSGGTISANFSDMYISLTNGGPSALIVSEKSILGNFSNLKLNISSDSCISGEYLYINVTDLDITLFQNCLSLLSANQIMSSTFSNIKINSSDGFSGVSNLLSSTDGFNCNIDGLKVKTTILSLLNSQTGTQSGEFKNFEIKQTLSAFQEGTSTNVNTNSLKLENLYFGSVSGGCFKTLSSNIIIEMKNVEVRRLGDGADFLSTAGSAFLKISDLKLNHDLSGTPGNIIQSQKTIFGEFNRINISKADFIFSGLTVSIVVDDFKFGQTTGIFLSQQTLSGTFSNIETNETQFAVFSSSTGKVDVNIKNSNFDIINDRFVIGRGGLNAKLDNVIVNSLNNNVSDFLTAWFGEVNLEVSNSRFLSGNNNNKLFSRGSEEIFYGTFSNIEIGTSFNTVFENNGGNVLNLKDVYIRQTNTRSIMKGEITGKFENVQSFNRLGGSFIGSIIQNSVFIDPFANPSQSAIAMTSSSILENTDFYYSFTDTLSPGVTINYSIQNAAIGTISNAHVLNCGMINPPAGSRYSNGSEFNRGVTALGPSFNVFNIPQPKELN